MGQWRTLLAFLGISSILALDAASHPVLILRADGREVTPRSGWSEPTIVLTAFDSNQTQIQGGEDSSTSVSASAG
jgi:hypothetical protein